MKVRCVEGEGLKGKFVLNQERKDKKDWQDHGHLKILPFLVQNKLLLFKNVCSIVDQRNV